VSACAPDRPELSVVIAVATGGLHVDQCLEALEHQRDAPSLEIIVPVDGGLPASDVARWRERFPAVRISTLTTPGASTGGDPGPRHLRTDMRRAAGLAAASAPIVALTEDHARPAPDWCRSIVRAHAALPHPAIGGAIDNASPQLLARAVHLCDFGRYQRPLPSGPADFVSDVNVSYKRNALESVRAHWRDGYHEPAVHQALRAQGGLLWLDPSIVVEQRRGRLALLPCLRERVAWGRLYAGKRCAALSPNRRAILVLLAPLLPALLLARQVRGAWTRRRGGLAYTLPLVSILLCAWSLGEAVGYWTGRPVARSASGAGA